VVPRAFSKSFAVFAALALFLPLPATAQSWPEVFDPLVVRDFQLEMDPADWDLIRFDLTNEIEVPALFSADGEAAILVSVRRKSSRALPSESNPVKVGLKIDINEYVDGQLWHGLNKLSLENGGDVPVLYEGMAWQLHQLASQAGFYGPELNAALANWVKVSVNGDALGVYTSVEQRDSQFLRNRGVRVKDQTWLYEVDDINGWALEDGDPHSPAFTELCYAPFAAPVKGKKGTAACVTPPDSALAATLDQLIELDAMLAQGAVDAFSANPDALFTHGKNFHFADFSHNGLKRRYYPWDMDAVFRAINTGIYGDAGKRSVTQTPYEKILLNHPELRVRYNEILGALMAGPLSEASVAALLDAIEPVLVPALLEDPFQVNDPVASFDQLRNWLPARIANVEGQISANGPPAPR
jgi:hypothetical protein